MEPKCNCGADLNALTSKRHFISAFRTVRIIYCSQCGKIYGILEDSDVNKQIERIEKNIRK